MSNLLDAPIKHLLESLYLMGIGDEHGCRVNVPIQDLIDIINSGEGSGVFDLENEGTGVDLYNGKNPTTKKLKIARINCDDGSLIITKNSNGSLSMKINPQNIPIPDYPITGGISEGGGLPIYTGITGKKIKISSLASEDNSIEITYKDGLINLKKNKTNLISSDNTLIILNDNDIIAGVSSINEEFIGLQSLSLGFKPSNLLGIYVNGLKLNSKEFEIILPKSIKIKKEIINTDVVSIDYEHKII